ncbi:MAG: hypothetical protein K0R54_609 [Clostridiaceae bacterium]|nr:hypothetical protein [Clostridiaceae bacterium]
MNDINRGQKVYVSLKNEIKETTVKSVGSKYVTLECDSSILFDRRTLRKAGSGHSKYFIITDIKKYEEYYKELIDRIKDFKWDKVNKEDLEKVADILKKY